MSNVIDLSKRLDNSDKPRIKIDAEHSFEVRNNKNVVILLDEISKDEKIEVFAKDGDKTDKIIETALGEDALKYLKTLDISANGWNIIVEAIIAAVNEIEFEEVEKSAKEAAGGKVKDFRK